MSEIYSVVAPIAELDLSAPERLRRMVHTHIAVVAAETAMLAVVFREEPELPEDAQKAIRRRKRSYEALFERVIEEDQEAGLLRDLPTRLAVMALLGMCKLDVPVVHPRPVRRRGSGCGVHTAL